MSEQHCNEASRALIRSKESLALKAYRCPAGVPTIGWGHTRGVRMGDKCSRAQADAWFDEDVAEAEAPIRKLVRVPLTDNQFSALVSWVFNLGVKRLLGSTLLKRLNARQYEDVPGEMRRWVMATVNGKRVKLPGLKTRRDEEAALWNTPDSPEA